MATTATTSDQTRPPTRRPRIDPLNERSPLPLSASQEGQVREIYYRRVRQHCADEVREFATCAMNRTFTATFMCRGEQKKMNECMVKHATQEEQDAARTEWFATIDARHEARVKKEEKRVRDEKFWRSWWDKDLSKKPSHDAPLPGEVAAAKKS